MATSDVPTQQIGNSFNGQDVPLRDVVEKVTIPEVMDRMRVVRARFAKTTITEYLESLTPPLNNKYVVFHETHSYFDTVCAGAKHHHWWRGGLAQHVREMIGVCLDLYDLYRGDLANKITRDDIIIACYLHDFAKVWAYEELGDDDREKHPHKYLDDQLFRPHNGAFNIVDEESKTLLELARAGIVPSELQWSAVLFAEGGYSDRNFTIGGRLTRTADTIMSRNPLAVLVHMADMYSSQILGGSLV